MAGLHLTTVRWRDRATVAPALPADLERAIEAARPYVVPGLIIPGRPAEYHPLAARYALTFAHLLEPASHDVIEQWVLMLTAGIPNRPREESEFQAWQDAAMIALGNLPSGVWCQETLGEALGHFVFWPAIAEVKRLLLPHAERLKRTLRHLEEISAAPRDRAPQGPAREAPERPIEPAVSTPATDAPVARTWTAHAPVRTPEQQLAALGYAAGWQPERPASGEDEYRSWFAPHAA